MPDYPPNCGQRFSYLLSTDDWSRSITKPCGDAAILPEIMGDAWICQPSDLEVAQGRVGQAKGLVLSAWENLLDAEGGDAPQIFGQPLAPTPVADSWRPEVEAWLAKVGDLSPIVINITLEPHITYRWTLVAEGACLIDALSRAAVELGGETIPDQPFVPDPEPDPTPIADAGKAVGWVILAAVVVGGGIAYARSRR